MFYRNTLFEKKDSQKDLIKKLWPTQVKLPIKEIERLLEGKTQAQDTVYIHNCDAIPLLLEKKLFNRSLIFIEPRDLLYKWLSVFLQQRRGNFKGFDNVWRELQPFLKYRELEGIPMFKLASLKMDLLADKADSLQNNYNYQEPVMLLSNDLDGIAEDLQGVLSLLFCSVKKRLPQNDWIASEVLRETFNDYQMVSSNIEKERVYFLGNEDLDHPVRRKARLILVLPSFNTELKSFGMRLNFQKSLAHVFEKYGGHLKPNGYLSIIVPDKKYYPELVNKESEKNNWVIDSFEDIQGLEGGFLLFNYVKSRNNPINGSLKRLQRVNQLDLEEEIIKDIRRYLKHKNIASTQDIRKHLILKSPFGIPQQPLEEMLREYFPYHKDLFFNGVSVTAKNHKDFRKEKDIISELSCRYLLKAQRFISYQALYDYLQNISFAALYDLPYYYMFKRFCYDRKFKQPGEYFANKLVDKGNLRKILLARDEFFEPIGGELIGTYVWPLDQCLDNFKNLLVANKEENILGLEKNILLQFKKFLSKLDISTEYKESLLSFLVPKGRLIESKIG